MADEDNDKMESIRLGDSVRGMVEAGTTREESDAVIAAAARYTWWGEDCREIYGLTQREWAVLIREQSRLNPGKRELTPAELRQRREAGPKGGRPRKPEKTGETGPSQRREGEKKEIRPEEENEEYRSSVSGFSLKVSDSDMMRARMLAGEREAVEVALEWAGETGSMLSKNTFARACRRLGVKAFAEVVCAADAEARADGEPRKRGAALNRKLQNALAAAPVEVAHANASQPPMRPAAVPAEPEPPPAAVEDASGEGCVACVVSEAFNPFKRDPLRPLTPEEEEANRREKAAKWEEYKRKREASMVVTDG